MPGHPFSRQGWESPPRGAPASRVEQVSRTVLGPVDVSCEKWTSTPKPSPESDVYQAWVFGLISGINLESTYKDFLQGRNLDAVIAWMDNYCRSNPLVAVPQAAQELSKVLRAGR